MEQPRFQVEQVEYDTQVMDLVVVDENARVIGRPSLTVLLDVRTRDVIGYDISLNSPPSKQH